MECQSILCPGTTCANPVTPPGECCPTCADTLVNSYCEYEGDGRKHPAGTTWHPYIPPWGFSKCTICTCKVAILPFIVIVCSFKHLNSPLIVTIFDY